MTANGEVSWVYIAGEATEGKTIKIGFTKSECVAARLKSINGEQHSAERYVLLAAFHANRGTERIIQDYFDESRLARGARREYFRADDRLTSYVLWVRAQHAVSLDENAAPESVPWLDQAAWLPNPTRHQTVTRDPEDEDTLLPRTTQLRGPLAGTAWDWMPDPLASYNDYFTPPEIVQCAADAMGGIDLDAASHFLANKDLVEAGVTVGDYYTINRSAFEQPWTGRVWLNPPYGDYLPWFRRAADERAAGRLVALCMLSPMWAFATKQAQPFMQDSGAMVVLTPTPTFRNPGNPTKTGSNQPHAIVYWGGDPGRFLRAFAGHIPCRLDWTTI